MTDDFEQWWASLPDGWPVTEPWKRVARAAWKAALTPSADVPACRDDDPVQPAILAACYPDPPEYQHPDGDPQ